MKNFKRIFSIFCLMLIVAGTSELKVRAEVLPFNLGEIEIEHQEKTISFELAGILSIPRSEGDFPIVFILPDIEAGQEATGRYNQFLNVSSEMSTLGIVLDLSPLKDLEAVDEALITTVFEYYRVELNRALQGESLAFGKDLYNKGSFSEVVIIGCGQSVDSVYQIIEKQHEKQMSVKGVMLIDPRRNREVPDSMLPDIPTAMVLSYPLLEQNTISLSLFQKIRKEESRQSATSMLYVQPDASLVHSGEFEYFNFVNQYAASFLQSIFDVVPEGVGLSPLEIAPQMIFNTAVKSSLIIPDSLPLLNPKTERDPHFNALGGNNRFINLRLDHYKGLVDTYKVKWEMEDSLLEIELPKEHRDLTHYDALSLYINYHNEGNESLSFAVEFCDMEGQVQQIKLDNMQPLNYFSGTAIPFYNERILLSDLMGVDLTSVRCINFIFKDKNSGELSIGDITLIKAPN